MSSTYTINQPPPSVSPRPTKPQSKQERLRSHAQVYPPPLQQTRQRDIRRLRIHPRDIVACHAVVQHPAQLRLVLQLAVLRLRFAGLGWEDFWY